MYRINDKDQIEIVKYVHKARGEVYTFFDKFFRLLPNEDFFHMVEQNIPYLKVISESDDNEDMREGAAQLADFFDRKANLDEKERAEYLLEALRRYTSLFCLTDSVPMTESYYVSPDGISMSEAYAEVKKFMRKHGYNRPEDVREFEDHLSQECALMAYLAFGCVQMLERGEFDKYDELTQEQFAFHENHFDKWVNVFVGVVLAYPGHEQVFKAMVRFLKGYLSEDKQLLSEIISPINFVLEDSHN